MFPGPPERLRDFDYLGLQRYSLCFCTIERQPLFTTQAVVDLVMQQFLRAGAEQSFVLIAYCFMPDHVHLLAAGKSEAADAKRYIKLAKQYSGFYYKQANRRRLWQRYPFEHVLRDDETTFAVARYIIENPVRAGLVSDPRDYPFLGSQVCTLDEILSAMQDDVAPNFDMRNPGPAKAGRHTSYGSG